MKIAKFNVAASLLAIAMMLFSVDLSAQNLTFKVGGDDKEKKEVVKEKIVDSNGNYWLIKLNGVGEYRLF